NVTELLELKLDREANLTSNVVLVLLTQQNVIVEAGTSCEVAIWGTCQTGGCLSCFPRVDNVTVTPKDHCRHNSVCTGVLTCQGGICQGDGGSPLICNGLAHGVASFTMEHCSWDPNFFTCVARFQNWIDSVLNPPAGLREAPSSRAEPVTCCGTQP
ncbi:PREDICTED: azurocidin-like, partial [Galeopterus variegatus]|uniref:Azurocidin-like n=1 Tax=Galeopterus variegatus TaxID=482537 RepID=A0ABM0Q2H2_GALVR